MNSEKLYRIFVERVEMQRTQPQYDWNIIIEDNEYFDGAQWFFFKYDSFTNIPSLGIGFTFTPEQEQKFLSLLISGEFQKDVNSAEIAYIIDCGDDAKKATVITDTVLKEIFNCDEELPFKLVNYLSQHPKEYIERNNHIFFRFDNLPYDSKIFSKIRKIVTYYNKKAEKYANFDSKINFIEEKRTIVGYFEKQDENSSRNYFINIRTAGRNANLRAEIVKVINLCYKLFETYASPQL